MYVRCLEFGSGVNMVRSCSLLEYIAGLLIGSVKKEFYFLMLGRGG